MKLSNNEKKIITLSMIMVKASVLLIIIYSLILTNWLLSFVQIYTPDNIVSAFCISLGIFLVLFSTILFVQYKNEHVENSKFSKDLEKISKKIDSKGLNEEEINIFDKNIKELNFSTILKSVFKTLLNLNNLRFIDGLVIFIEIFIIALFTSLIYALRSYFYEESCCHKINSYDWIAVFQSNKQESIEFFTSNVIPNINFFGTILVFIFTIIICIFIVSIFLLVTKRKKIARSDSVYFKFVVFFISVVLVSVNIFNSSLYESYIIARDEFKSLTYEFQKIKAENSFYDKTELNYASRLNVDENELYVLVIGESQARDYMGIYNSMFNTSPNLQNIIDNTDNNVINFTNAYSSFTHTLQAIGFAFTPTVVADNINADVSKFDYKHNLVTTLKRVGIDTYWLSNQHEIGTFDNWISLMANESVVTEHGAKIYHGSFDNKPDGEVIIPLLNEHIQANSFDVSKKSKLLIIHLFGSHSKYLLRFPQGYEKKFPRELSENEKKEVIRLEEKKVITEDELENVKNYLVATSYNDEIINTIYDRVSTLPNFMGMVYFSDHGEDPTEPGHNINKFKFSKTRIPLLFFASKNFIKKYPQKMKNALNNKDMVWINDKIYDLILDLFSVETKYSNNKNSIFNERFNESDNSQISTSKKINEDPLK